MKTLNPELPIAFCDLIRRCFFLFACIPFICLAQFDMDFKENKNQWDDRVKFKADIPGGQLYFTSQGLVYNFFDMEQIPLHADTDHHGAKVSRQESNLVDAHAFSITFTGANFQVQPYGEQPASANFNYFLGNDPARWASGVKSYQTLAYPDLYEGIDLKIYALGDELKYDFIVDPGANPKHIKMAYEGAKNMALLDGDLSVVTSVNRILEQKPIAYQIINKDTVFVPCQFKLKKNTVSFDIGKYDQHEVLIIDPLLIFSTYSGSTADNWGFTATYDSVGNLYAGGIVFNQGFPFTLGAYQINFRGNVDMGILKFDSTGSNLIYGTYLGGSEADVPHSLVVNNNDELLILGSTGSADYPTTISAYDKSFNFGAPEMPVNGTIYSSGSDIVISKLNTNGSQLVGSTFFGGSGNDGISIEEAPLTKNYGDQFRGDIIMDAEDHVYIASQTTSTDIVHVNPMQENYGGGGRDVLIAKFNAQLSSLIWSTYIGGNQDDAAYSIKLDSINQVYFAGGTNSGDFPTSSGSYQENYQGEIDGFVAMINQDSMKVLASTLVGTSNYDQIYSMDLDVEQNVYVLGQTQGNYPVSPDVYANSNSGQFIHKLSGDLTTGMLSTVFGSSSGGPDISPTAFLVNECGNIMLSGWGGAVNGNSPFYVGGDTFGMPITDDAFQNVTDGSDFYLMVLSEGASEILYGTYMGALGPRGREHVDGGTSRFDKRGIVYQSACASCRGQNEDINENASNFPTTSGAWSTTNKNNQNFNCNNAAFKFDLSVLKADFEIIREDCESFTVFFDNKSIGGKDFLWDLGDGNFSNASGDLEYTYAGPGIYNISLTVVDKNTCKVEDIAVGTVNLILPQIEVGEGVRICKGESVQLNASGGISYSWSPVTGITGTNKPNPIVLPAATTTYVVTIVGANECIYRDSIKIEVAEIEIEPDFDISEQECGSFTKQFNNTSIGGDQWHWDFGDGTTSNLPQATHTYAEPGNYLVTLTVTESACGVQESVQKEIVLIIPEIEVSADLTVCEGDQVMLEASGGITYNWREQDGPLVGESSQIQLTPEDSTTYIVEITALNGCTFVDSIKIGVIPNLELAFEVVSKFNCEAIPTYEFINKSTFEVPFIWSFGDEHTSQEIHPIHTYESSGTYLVSLSAPGFELCSPDYQIMLEANSLLEIPNVITPNGDGKNDFFVIKSHASFHIKIFNRLGMLIYQQQYYDNTWDASGLNEGTYYYELLSTDETESCTGWVQVFR